MFLWCFASLRSAFHVELGQIDIRAGDYSAASGTRGSADVRGIGDEILANRIDAGTSRYYYTEMHVYSSLC